MDKMIRNLFLGFAGGLAAAAVVPFLKPIAQEVGRPLVKITLKQSLLFAERVKTVAARFAESVEDLFAEVHAEVESQLAAEAALDSPAGELHVLRESQLPQQPLRGVAH